MATDAGTAARGRTPRSPAPRPRLRLSAETRGRILRIVRPVLAAAAVAGVAAVLTLWRATERYAADVAIVGIGAVSCAAILGLLGASIRGPRRTPFDTLRRTTAAEPASVRAIDEIEWALLDVKWGRASVGPSIVDLLAPIVRARLIERRHVDPQVDPAAAREILGDDAWGLLQRPAAATAPGTDSGATLAATTAAPATPLHVTNDRVIRLIEILEEL